MIVRLMPQAEADIMSIGDYIAADNRPSAVRFVDALLQRCADLADMPRAFPLVPRYEASGVRRRNYGRYAIFYRVSGDKVEVLHILHGAQDYERVLFPQD